MSKKQLQTIQKRLGEDIRIDETYTESDFASLDYHEISKEGHISHDDGAKSTITRTESSDKLLHFTIERTDVWDYSWNINIAQEKKINYEKFLGTWKNSDGKYSIGVKYDPNGKLVRI